MGAATVGEHAGHADDQGGDQDDETDNQDHDTLRNNAVAL